MSPQIFARLEKGQLVTLQHDDRGLDFTKYRYSQNLLPRIDCSDGVITPKTIVLGCLRKLFLQHSS